MAFWRTKQFKLLNKEWDEKLTAQGFNDIEVAVREDRVLKQRASNVYLQASSLERDTRLIYYCRLSGLVANTKFPNELEKEVMERHAEGASILEITRELLKLGLYTDRKNIRHVIRHWQTEWGIKIWKPQQRSLKLNLKIIKKTRIG